MTRSPTTRFRLARRGGVATASAALVAACLGAGAANAAVSSGALDCAPQALEGTAGGRALVGWDGVQKDPHNHTEAEVAAMEADFQIRLTQLGAIPDVDESIDVEVYYHVVRADRTVEGGNVPRSWIREQNKYLNHSFRGKGHSDPGARTPFKFSMTDVDRTTNDDWFLNAAPSSAIELEMKTALRTPGSTAETLNVYLTNQLNVGLLGYAYYPSNYDDSAESPILDGIVVESQSLPGGSFAPFDLGGTVVHEAGHWVGLYHTFQGGCDGPKGDRVEDTPKMTEPTSGCPEGKDSCAEADGLDPIHNYMDYSDDACYDQFTIGQRERSKDQWYAYREGVA